MGAELQRGRFSHKSAFLLQGLVPPLRWLQCMQHPFLSPVAAPVLSALAVVANGIVALYLQCW